MDEQRIGRVVRALRRRRGWRQVDLAAAAGCSQSVVSDLERGHLERASMPIIRRILAALDARLIIDVRWNGAALDRLVDEDHAKVVAAVSGWLMRLGWLLEVEVTYSEWGERGSIDMLAFWPPGGTLLVIEVKTDLPSAEAVLRKLDEKVRLAPTIARKRFDGRARALGRLVVMPESSTLRRRVDRHAAVFARALPLRGRSVHRWLSAPDGAVAGLWFLSANAHGDAIRPTGGRDRVRMPKRPSLIAVSDR